jgi:hypothetical protein
MKAIDKSKNGIKDKNTKEFTTLRISMGVCM